MFGLTAIHDAMKRLAASLNGLSASLEQIDGGIRERLQLDGPEPQPVECLPPPLPEAAPPATGRKRTKAA